MTARDDSAGSVGVPSDDFAGSGGVVPVVGGLGDGSGVASVDSPSPVSTDDPGAAPADEPGAAPANDSGAATDVLRCLTPSLPEGLELRLDERGLALVGGGMELLPDFAEMLPRLRADRLGRELLVRAARVKGAAAPTCIDATAGLGEDSLLLAAAGFEVTLCEADPVIAALLADAVRRAAGDSRLAGIVSRMHVHEGDSVALLDALGARDGFAPEPGLAACEPDAASGTPVPGVASVAPAPARNPGPIVLAHNSAALTASLASPDVVYLDPMFPARSKSAAVKKKFQLLHRLESPCANEDVLMAAALAARPRKVVVKRPIKAPALAGVRPSYSLSGKAVRFDVIVPPSR